MTGLDKIIEAILAEAKAQSEEIVSAANKSAEGILEEAKKSADKVKSQSDLKLASGKISADSRAKSSADLKKRQAILKAKQEIITELIDKAYTKVLALPEEEYFQIVNKMLLKYAQKKDGEVYFSQKDLDRLPSDMETVLEKAATANGGKLTLVKEAKDIDGGFILVYGGIEENCSFKAIFDAERETLADKVNKFLFA